MKNQTKTMTITPADLQTIWEQLNGILYDLTEGDPDDAVEAVEDCISRLEQLGVGE